MKVTRCDECGGTSDMGLGYRIPVSMPSVYTQSWSRTITVSYRHGQSNTEETVKHLCSYVCLSRWAAKIYAREERTRYQDEEALEKSRRAKELLEQMEVERGECARAIDGATS